MKKFTKLFLSCAAVAALTAAVATSAMAADSLRGEIEGSYENGVLTLTAPADAAATKTLLVLDNGADKTDIKAADILGIDQNAEITEVKLDASKINTEEKTYTVLMGGGDKIYVAEFGKVTGEPIIIGDVDGKNGVRTADSTAILYYTVGNKPVDGRTANVGKTITKSDGTTTIVGDVDGKNGVRTADSTAILYYTVGNKPVDGRTSDVGTEILGTIAE